MRASPQDNAQICLCQIIIAALVWESYIKLGSHQSQDFDVDSDLAILSFCLMKNIIWPKTDVHLSPSHCFGDTGLESHCSGGLKAAEMIDVVKHFNWETYVAPSDRLTMSPCAATVWLERNERQMMIFCWHSLNISILWSGYKSATNRITLKQKKYHRRWR